MIRYVGDSAIRFVDVEPISKSDFESYTGVTISEEQWDLVAPELEGRINNFIDELFELVGQDISEGLFDVEEEA